ncbi:IS5 family transposase [Siccirubricoccus sp. G192]|uniref:IS5 family transposase n=1 Tax=Siccirubricoccus sp. G192 TaxID=2849651 RepID=UPI001C2C7412|nr:IS5 family transposase [Siccirubricoccus sp. G192]MBV1800454.1 IS5 family transposase [Siccirubricoccus sp. G192]
MPFKTNADRRHHIPRQRQKVTNWAEYEAGLRARGSLIVWFSEEAIQGWRAEVRTGRGGQPKYSNLAIATALTLRATMSRRAETLEVPRPRCGRTPVHLLVDSTGLRLCGPGDWLEEKHGTQRRRSWRKLHLATDADTGYIVASALTDKDADDGSLVGPLLDQIDGPVVSFTADGAFDRDDVHTEVTARHPDAVVVIPPRSSAVPSATAEIAPTQRDAHLQCIAERGRMGWQKASGYNFRALVESDISRWKRVIGDGLRSRTDGRQETEVAIATNALNRMLELGRPKYIRVA